MRWTKGHIQNAWSVTFSRETKGTTMTTDRLAEFMKSPYGRRLLVHGRGKNLADHVRKAAVAAGIDLVEIDSEKISITALVERLETLARGSAPAVVFIDHVERYRRVPRADWRIRGTTQHAQHLGVVMTIHAKWLLWITDPKAGFYGQLSQHHVMNGAKATEQRREAKATVRPSDFAVSVGRALVASAAEARRIARLNGMPVYSYRDGKVIAESPWAEHPALPPPKGHSSWLDYAVASLDVRSLVNEHGFGMQPQWPEETTSVKMRKAAREELRQLRQRAFPNDIFKRIDSKGPV